MAYYFDKDRIKDIDLDKIRASDSYDKSKKKSPCRNLSRKKCDRHLECTWRKLCMRKGGVTGTFNIAKNVKQKIELPKLKTEKRDIGTEIPGLGDVLSDIKRLVEDLWYVKSFDKSVTWGSPSSFFKRRDIDKNQIRKEDIKPNYKDKYPLLAVMTNFNTNNFFKNVEMQTRLVYLVITVYSTLLSEIYKKEPKLNKDNLDIIFKGGTTVRATVTNLMGNFVNDAENILNRYLSDSVKMSDFDFELVSSLEIKTNILNKVTNLAHLALLRVRNHLAKHPTAHFNFLNLRKEVQHEKMGQVLKELKNTITSLPKSHYFKKFKIEAIEYEELIGDLSVNKKKYKYFDSQINKNVDDFSVISGSRQSNGEFAIISTAELLRSFGLPKKYIEWTENKSLFYTTHSGSVYCELKAIDKWMNFGLSRIKYNYTVYGLYGKNPVKVFIPGEIIDLSHIIPGDPRKIRLKISSNPNYQRFTWLDNNLSYLSYSIKGQIKDLVLVLFLATDYKPWLDEKYKKRMKRLLVLVIFCYLMDSSRSMPYKIGGLDRLLRNIKEESLKDEDGCMNIEMNRCINKTFEAKGIQKKLFKLSVVETLEFLIQVVKYQYNKTSDQIWRVEGIKKF